MSDNRLLAASKGLQSPDSSSVYLLSIWEKKFKEDLYRTGISDVERVTLAFACLSEVLPHCGVYSPVLKLVKEELMSAVYGDAYTVVPENHFGNVTSPKLERVPYFVLMQRLVEQRNEAAESLQNDIDCICKKLSDAQDVLSKREEEMALLKCMISQLEEELALTKTKLEIKIKEAESQNQRIEDIEKKSHACQLELMGDIERLMQNKKALHDENGILRQYKISFDTLKDTFDLPPEKRPKRGFRRPILATRKTQLLSRIEAASKLEQQILEVQNKTLEEQDQFLEKVKKKLSAQRFSETVVDPNYYNEELMLESLSNEMAMRQKNFQRVISGIAVELELIRMHREALQGELIQLEQAEHGSRAIPEPDGSIGGATMVPSSMAGGRPGSSRMLLCDDSKKIAHDSSSIEDSGLDEGNTHLADTSDDLFNPQERVLSKYSAMIYTSVNGGKSFDEITYANFCKSCGEKTAICPHKITLEDKVIHLPKRCTHIKLARPQVKIAVSLSRQRQVQTSNAFFSNQLGADNWLATRQEPHRWDGCGEWRTQGEMHEQLSEIWDDFKSRTGIECQVLLSASRDLPHSRIISFIEQIYASIIWQDNHPSLLEYDDIKTVKDYLYSFMSERYQEDEITPMATFDFLAGVIKYAAQDKVVLLFGLVTCGAVDASVPRYIHQVADLIEVVEWNEVKDFTAFAKALYPFMQEEDIDQLVMEYTAFSENKISKSLVMDFLIHISLKNKEPRIQEAERKLSAVDVASSGKMTIAEFAAGMESFAPLTNEKLWRKLANETFNLHNRSAVPFANLAGIAAYVTFVQIIQLLKSQIVNRVTRARYDRRAKAPEFELSGNNQLVAETSCLLTVNGMKKLGYNIFRQRQAGSRQFESYCDDFLQSRPDTRDSSA